MSTDDNTEFKAIKELLRAERPSAEDATAPIEARRISIFSHHMVIAWLLYNFGAWMSLLSWWLPWVNFTEMDGIVPSYIYSVERGLLGRRGALQGRSVAKEAYLSFFATLLFGVGALVAEGLLVVLYAPEDLTRSFLGAALVGAFLSYLFYGVLVECVLRTEPLGQDEEPDRVGDNLGSVRADPDERENPSA